MNNSRSNTPRIVIVGAGFGGLFAARRLAKAKPAVDVLIIDRNNYHTFTPLLYQVASCALDPSEIAYPVRGIFSGRPQVKYLLGEVTALDTAARQVTVQAAEESHTVPYDYLLLAAGSTPTYFGNDAFRPHAFELRTLNDAVKLRHHLLSLFERAVWEDNADEIAALTTLVIVGGGPTGLETAGALYELYNHVLNQEYQQADLTARVILVEQAKQLLASYPAELQTAALEQLHTLGVEVILGHAVTEVAADHVTLDDGRVLRCRTLVWAAGVKGAPLATLLKVALQRNNTVPVTPTLEVKGLEKVYAVGDMAYLPDPNGNPYPMVIPVAQQQGKQAAENILAALAGRPQTAFRYHDRGSMATIGRSRAVAWIFNKIKLKGFIAWLAWLALHLLWLLGFRNRLNVLVNWVWNYLTYDRSVRIILESEPHAED